MPNAPDGRPAPRVGLLVTCLVDAIRPRIGFAAIQLLEEAGCIVEVPEAQTCCGQPAFNSGGTEAANGLARQVIAAFEPFDYRRGPLRLLRRDDPAALSRKRWPAMPSGRRAPGRWRPRRSRS